MLVVSAENVEELLDDAREVAATCGLPHASRMLHRLCEALEASESECAGLEALRLLSLQTVEDRETGFALRLREDPTGIARLLAGHFLDVLDDPRKWGAEGPNVDQPAPNYVEMRLRHDTRGSVVVTVQRVSGRTPHEMRASLQNELSAASRAAIAMSSERDAARAALADLKALLLKESGEWGKKLSDLCDYLSSVDAVIGPHAGGVAESVAAGLDWMRAELAK